MKYLVQRLSLVAAIACLFMQPSAVQAQSSDDTCTSIGAHAFLSSNAHSAAFKNLPGIPDCCPRYESGSGLGLMAGATIRIPWRAFFPLQLRLGFQQLSGQLQADEATMLVVNGRTQAGSFRHQLDATLLNIGIEPLLNVPLVAGLKGIVGPRFGFMTTTDFASQELISQPSNIGTFAAADGSDSRLRVRNVSSGSIPQASSLQFGIVVGLQYPLPLNKLASLRLIPEISYHRSFSSVATGLDWQVHSLRFGASVLYTPVPIAEVQSTLLSIDTLRIEKRGLKSSIVISGKSATRDSVSLNDNIRTLVHITERTDTLFAAQSLVRDVTLRASSDINSSSNTPLRIVSEEFASLTVTPLLPYVFFEDNSADIPSRYNTVQPQSTASFDETKLPSAERLQCYHHLLNIVGARMLQNPSATLSITGCNSDVRAERNNGDLSRRRAEAVRDYLVRTWHIAESRLQLSTRNLPTKHANSATVEAEQENRRVELSASLPEITAPLMLRDTLRTITPPDVYFHSRLRVDTAVSHWRLQLTQSGRTLKNMEADSTIPALIQWQVAEEPASIPRSSDALVQDLYVQYADGETQTLRDTLPVKHITIQHKREEHLEDKVIERFSMILFDIRSAQVGSDHLAQVDFIKKRIQPHSTVRVIGYTDKFGNVESNQRFAEKRAQNTAQLLGVDNSHMSVKGIGSATTYDSTLPEGRMYTRTVDILVETAIDNK